MSALRALAEYAGYVQRVSPGARYFLGAATLAGINAGVASVLLNLYIRSLGPEITLGQVLWAGPAGAIVAGLLSGPLVDRFGPKRAMLAGTVVAGVGALLLLLVPTLNGLRLGLAAVSMGSIAVYIAAPPLLVRHSTPVERKHLFAVTAAAYVVSTAIGSAVGGFLPQVMVALLGPASQAEVYRRSLFAGALLSALGLPLLLLVPDDAPEIRARAAPGALESAAGAGAGAGSGVARLRLALRQLPVRARQHRREAVVIGQFLLADSFIRVGGNLFIPFFNVYFVEQLGASTGWYGALRSLDRVVVVLATLLVAPIAVRYGAVATITATQLLSVPCMLAFGFAPGLLLASATFLARGALMEMTVPVRDSFLMEVVPERVRATANAILTLSGQALAVLTIPLGARLLDAGRYPMACALAAAMYVVSAALYWRFFHARPEAAPQRRPEWVVVPQG
ncbi:MAG TPA: MFS transporter [Chloroflexota bacterium]|nr:MFS transporter [Chloroflexota bacterium]